MSVLSCRTEVSRRPGSVSPRCAGMRVGAPGQSCREGLEGYGTRLWECGRVYQGPSVLPTPAAQGLSAGTDGEEPSLESNLLDQTQQQFHTVFICLQVSWFCPSHHTDGVRFGWAVPASWAHHGPQDASVGGPTPRLWRSGPGRWPLPSGTPSPGAWGHALAAPAMPTTALHGPQSGHDACLGTQALSSAAPSSRPRRGCSLTSGRTQANRGTVSPATRVRSPGFHALPVSQRVHVSIRH